MKYLAKHVDGAPCEGICKNKEDIIEERLKSKFIRNQSICSEETNLFGPPQQTVWEEANLDAS